MAGEWEYPNVSEWNRGMSWSAMALCNPEKPDYAVVMTTAYHGTTSTYKRFYYVPQAGDGSNENPYRPMMPEETSYVRGKMINGRCLVLTNCNMHMAIAANPQIIQFPNVSVNAALDSGDITVINNKLLDLWGMTVNAYTTLAGLFIQLDPNYNATMDVN